MPISTLSYQILADSSGFTKGANLARKEAAELRRLFVETRSPIEKYQAAQQALGDKLRAGKIDADLYGRSLRKIKEEHDGLGKSASAQTQLTNGLKQFGPAASAATALANPYTAAVVAIGGAAIGTAAAIGKLTSATIQLTSASIREIDTQVDQAAKLGMSATALGGLHAQAKLANIESETLDKGMQKLTRSLGDVGGDGKKTASALAAVGIDVKKFRELQPDQQFALLADATAKLKSPAEQMAFAFKVFGKSGAELVPVLREGGAASAEASAHWQRLAGNVSESERQMIGALADLQDQSQTALGGIGNIIAAEVSPALMGLHRDFQSLVTSPAMQGGLRDAMQGVSGAIIVASAGAKDLVGFLSSPGFLTAINAAMPFASLAAKMAGGSLDNFRKIGAAYVLAEKLKAEIAADKRAQNGAGGDAFGEQDRAEKAAAEAAKRGSKGMNDMLREASEIYKQSRTPQQEYNDRMRTLAAHLSAGTIGFKTWGQAAQEAKDKLAKDSKSDSTKFFEETVKDLQRQRDALKGLTTSKAEEAQQKGASAEQVDEIGAIEKEVKAAEKMKRFRDAGRSVRDSSFSSSEQFEREAEKLRLMRGIGAIDDKAFQNANRKLAGERMQGGEQFARTIERGSQAEAELNMQIAADDARLKAEEQFNSEQLAKLDEVKAELTSVSDKFLARLDELMGTT